MPKFRHYEAVTGKVVFYETVEERHLRRKALKALWKARRKAAEMAAKTASSCVASAVCSSKSIVVGKQQVQFDVLPFVNCDGC